MNKWSSCYVMLIGQATGNGSSWGILPPAPHDYELDDLLNAQVQATTNGCT